MALARTDMMNKSIFHVLISPSHPVIRGTKDLIFEFRYLYLFDYVKEKMGQIQTG